MSASSYCPCPVCGAPNPTIAPVCGHCRTPLSGPTGYAAPAYAPPPASAYSAPPSSAFYHAGRTASVLKRISGMVLTIRLVSAFIWAVNGAFWGLLLGFAAANITSHDNLLGSPAPILCSFLGVFLGGAIGWFLSALLVVWMEWAGQVLSALDALAQR